MTRKVTPTLSSLPSLPVLPVPVLSVAVPGGRLVDVTVDVVGPALVTPALVTVDVVGPLLVAAEVGVVVVDVPGCSVTSESPVLPADASTPSAGPQPLANKAASPRHLHLDRQSIAAR